MPNDSRTPNERTAAKRSQRIRQRERVQEELRASKGEARERTGERNRARRDRDALADWIEELLPAMRVERKSGWYRVVERTPDD